MKNHVWRPLFVVLGLVAVILLARLLIVPDDFSVGERGYMYGYHRIGNEQEWKDFKTKFRTSNYCNDCHPEKITEGVGSPHAPIECENCHGLAGDHPENPEKLTLDRSRELCLRCHTYLAYPSSQRKEIAGIDPNEHNPGDPCVDCHNPHRPNLEEM